MNGDVKGSRLKPGYKSAELCNLRGSAGPCILRESAGLYVLSEMAGPCILSGKNKYDPDNIMAFRPDYAMSFPSKVNRIIINYN